MILTIRQKIKDKLTTLVWTWKPLVEVFDYHTIDCDWYPYVSFESTWLNRDFEDTCNNMRTLNFDLYVYQNLLNNDRQTAVSDLYNAVQNIIDTFDKDYTLWGTAEWWVNARNVEFWAIISDKSETLIAIIKLEVKTLYFIN